jgi:hypothetical protein
MNEQEQRMFLRFLVGLLKEHYRELAVHRTFAETLRQDGYQDVDAILETARSRSELDREIEKRFAWIDELVPPTDAENYRKALREYLEKWKPDGEPN